MKNSFLLMMNWAVALKGLPEHTTSELIKMICEYQIDGTIKVSDDVTAMALFESWKPKIDANNEAYEETVRRRSEAGKKGMASRWGHNKAITNDNKVITQHNKAITNDNKGITNHNDTDTDTVTDIYIYPPISPKGESPESVINNSELSDPVKSMLKDWVQYKRERREGYKPAGLKSLVTTATRYDKTVGADAVCEVIRKSMSSGYKGIVWDRLDNRAPVKENKFNNYAQNDYDFDALEKELIKN